MIISSGRAYVFVHIPKTGGTSLSLALEQRAMKDDILLGDTPKALKRRRRAKALTARGRLWKHSTLADIDGVMPVEKLTDMFLFTMVRNPWDRMFSYYTWLQTQTFDHPAVRLARSSGFDAFVLHPATLRAFRDHPSRSYMTLANGVEHCRAYIRLEHFEQDAEPLFDHLGFRVALSHVNRSDRDADYRPAYTPQTAEAVARACADDIERFGYSFDQVGRD